ncbi:universal stress protein [Chloroflexota bacterium]
MYQKIMVPLDGSELAECVLPHVEFMAKKCQVSEITFVRVVEPVHYPIGMVSDGWSVLTAEEAKRTREEVHAYNRAAAEDYLSQLLSRLDYDGVSLRFEVIDGKAADSLVGFAENNKTDLIIIATHGRSGVSRWVWGSVAERVLRSASMPVLMVRATGCLPDA